MVTLYFVRHGETQANVDGILTGTLETDLTQKGRDDAKALAGKLPKKFDVCICSPLRRTWQTLLAIKGDVKFLIDERITEICSGEWQGRKKSELPVEEYTLYKKGLLNPPKGEKLDDVNKRILDFLTDIFSKFRNNEKILVVTHNGLMRQLKRMFDFNQDAAEPKNLEVFEVNFKMFEKLKKCS